MKTGNWRYPLSRIPVKMLSFEVLGSALHRVHCVSLGEVDNVAGCQTGRQRANGNHNPQAPPDTSASPTMSQQRHPSERFPLHGIIR